jgi:hypothetical protein
MSGEQMKNKIEVSEAEVIRVGGNFYYRNRSTNIPIFIKESGYYINVNSIDYVSKMGTLYALHVGDLTTTLTEEEFNQLRYYIDVKEIKHSEED